MSKRSISLALVVAVSSLLSLATASGGAAAQPAARAVVFGTGGWAFPSPATLQRLGRHGLRTWRLTMSWADVSPRPGVMDFSGYDQVIRAAARARIEVMVTLTGCPAWACPGGGPAKSGAPLDGFEAFVAAAVGRYGSHGSLWSAGGKRKPVRYWQVLNEVNGADQWPHPSPSGYAVVLTRTAAVIRAHDRRAKVVMAGLGEKMTIWLRRYLPALYRRPGVRRAFDVIAPEGYAVHPRDVPRILSLTRRIMRRFGDRRKPMFVTEMSWSSGGPAFPFTTSPAGQAARMRTAWRLLRACRSRWRLRRVYWFAYDDRPAPLADDYWGFHNGLVDVGGDAKPAWHTFLRFLRPVRSAGRAGRCPLR